MTRFDQPGRIVFLLCAWCLLPMAVRGDLWCMGYYPGWNASALPVSSIDFTTVTHIVHFSLLPNSDGTLNSSDTSITPEATTALVSAAHAANRKAIICVGGEGTSFSNAASTATVSNLVSNLTNFMAKGSYDGIDVDWEPLPDGDGPLYTNFIVKLRAALDQFSTHQLLTTAMPVEATPSIVRSVQDKLDQINLMTYDLSGPWEGWVTWFNSPIYDGGYTFTSVPGELIPSIDGCVTHFTAGGVAPNKLGIGVAFYGYVWSGGSNGTGNGMTTPRESWTVAPAIDTLTYNQIVSSNFPASLMHYDTVAQAAWVGVDGPGTNDLFISYDDPRACKSKVSYARNQGLGGMIIWELTQDHMRGQPDALLQAIKEALGTPGKLALQLSGTNASLSFAGAPLGSYRVQWNSNLAAGAWNSLTLTNLELTATGGLIQVTDPGFPDRPARFYRVQTPP